MMIECESIIGSLEAIGFLESMIYSLSSVFPRSRIKFLLMVSQEIHFSS